MSFLIQDMFSVKGKVVVVTGGGSGIGKYLTTAFVANGAKVYITGRRMEVLEATAKELGELVIPIQGDLSTKGGAKAMADQIASKTSVIDTLINCAGVSVPFKKATSQHEDPDSVQEMMEGVEDYDFDYTNQININGVFFTTTFLTPLLRKSENPSVVVIASIAGLAIQRAMGSLTYGVSKAAAIQLSRQLSGRLHPMKIRVNCICPGIFPSEMTGQGGKDGGPVELAGPAAAAAKRSTMGRPGKPQEIAAPILMLSSVGGMYINNALINVDGGRLLVMQGLYDGIRMPEDTYTY
ncbi:hypothetical protein P7C73_g5740, partial [Tremellales sp. Uapishka_1]